MADNMEESDGPFWPPLVRHVSPATLTPRQEVYVITTHNRKICIKKQIVGEILPECIRLQDPAVEVPVTDLQMGPDNACRTVLFSAAAPDQGPQYQITQRIAEVKVGDQVTVFAKILHAQDPTQLLLKQLTGVVTAVKGCITFGTHSIYEENTRLEKESNVSWNTDLMAFLVTADGRAI